MKELKIDDSDSQSIADRTPLALKLSLIPKEKGQRVSMRDLSLVFSAISDLNDELEMDCEISPGAYY